MSIPAMKKAKLKIYMNIILATRIIVLRVVTWGSPDRT
jgi:hypothetical protein